MPDARREGMTAEDAEYVEGLAVSDGNIHDQAFYRRTLATYHALAASQQEVERLRRDVQAYREALGYGIAGEYPARLSDGTLPTNAEADAFRREMHKAKDARAAAREDSARLREAVDGIARDEPTIREVSFASGPIRTLEAEHPADALVRWHFGRTARSTDAERTHGET